MHNAPALERTMEPNGSSSRRRLEEGQPSRCRQRCRGHQSTATMRHSQPAGEGATYRVDLTEARGYSAVRPHSPHNHISTRARARAQAHTHTTTAFAHPTARAPTGSIATVEAADDALRDDQRLRDEDDVKAKVQQAERLRDLPTVNVDGDHHHRHHKHERHH